MLGILYPILQQHSAVKLKKLFQNRLTGVFLCLLLYLTVMGIVAENQPWGRGWWHDLKWAIRKKMADDPKNFPSADSTEGKELQRKFEEWIPQIIERYPHLKVEYKEVPDELNGFLKILEWQEEIDSNGTAREPAPLPDQFDAVLSLKSKLSEVPEELIHAAEIYLDDKKDVLDRAMAIGLLPGQSTAGIPPDYHFPEKISFAKVIVDSLKLKALVEARRGDFTASLQTLQAMRGWGDHYGEVETPSLLASTLATAIHLSVQNTAYKVLPTIPQESIDWDEWDDLTDYDNDIGEKLRHLFRGEWHSIVKAEWVRKELLKTNPRDLKACLASYARIMDSLGNPETLSGERELAAPNHLTRKSRGLIELLLIGIFPFQKGYLRSQAILRQYEIAFTLRRLESEGHDLKSLDQKTLDSLPLEILPGIDLAIDFDKRENTAPTDKIPPTTPISF